MLIEIENDGPLRAIVLQGVPSQRRASPIFIWMDISLRSRLLVVVADAAIISEVRGKSETSEQNPFFCNKTAGRRCSKKGSGRPFVLDLKRNCHVFKEVIAPAVVEHPLSVHQIYHNSRAISSILSDTLDFCRGLAAMIRRETLWSHKDLSCKGVGALLGFAL